MDLQHVMLVVSCMRDCDDKVELKGLADDLAKHLRQHLTHFIESQGFSAMGHCETVALCGLEVKDLLFTVDSKYKLNDFVWRDDESLGNVCCHCRDIFDMRNPDAPGAKERLATWHGDYGYKP